jgi:hypothetical protein
MTITEHFEQAKKDGHEWADAAISNMEKARSGEYEWPQEQNDEIIHLSDAIFRAFKWEMTWQGYDFWEKIWIEQGGRFNPDGPGNRYWKELRD